jgi:hypothetical protein
VTPIPKKRPTVQPLDCPQENRLNKLAGRTLVCGAFVLSKACLDEKETKLCFISNDLLARDIVNKYKLHHKTVFPIVHNEVDFYLHYSACVHHIQMSAKSVETALFGAPLEGHLWDISSSDLKEMAQKNWNYCLVNADKTFFAEKK